MIRLPLLLACLCLALFAAACGDDDDEQEAAATPAGQSAEPTPEPAGEIDAGAISTDLNEKPEVTPPEGAPPAELVSEDLVKGKGPAAKPGDTVSMQYVGIAWSTGTQFDASWDRGREPFPFQLGGGMVIPGWDQGIVGMRQGGRRLLVIPPDLAYGAQSPSPDIGPNETLIFVVDLEQIR